MKKIYKNISVAIIALTLVGIPSFVKAEEGTTDSASGNTTGATPALIQNRLETKAEMQRKQEELKATREEAKNQIEQKRLELQEKRGELKENRTELKENIKQKVEERKSKLKEDVKNRIERHAKKIIEKTNAMIERVETLVLRVESRIKKVSERGIDTTEATRFITQAKEEIAAAKTDAGKLAQAVTDALVSENPKEALDETFKTLLGSIKQNLKDAHRALENAVSSIKAGINKIETASTTPPTI